MVATFHFILSPDNRDIFCPFHVTVLSLFMDIRRGDMESLDWFVGIIPTSSLPRLRRNVFPFTWPRAAMPSKLTISPRHR